MNSLMRFNFTANGYNLIGYLFFCEYQRLSRCSQNLLSDFCCKIHPVIFVFIWGGTLPFGINFIVSLKWDQQFESFCQFPFPILLYRARCDYLTCFVLITTELLIINSELLLQLERVNLSAAQTLRAAFIKVRRNLHWKMVVSKVSCVWWS